MSRDQEDDRNKRAGDRKPFQRLTAAIKLWPAMEMKSPDFICQQYFSFVIVFVLFSTVGKPNCFEQPDSLTYGLNQGSLHQTLHHIQLLASLPPLYTHMHGLPIGKIVTKIITYRWHLTSLKQSAFGIPSKGVNY